MTIECPHCGESFDPDDDSSELKTCEDCGAEVPEDDGYESDSGVFRCDSCMSSHDE